MDRRTKNRARAMVAATIALVFTGLLILAVSKVSTSHEEQLLELAAANRVHTLPVVVATQTLYAGFEIRPDDLQVIDVPAELVPVDSASTPHLVVGRVPAERILEGDPIREARLADFSASRGLAALVPDGLRAISLNLAHARAGAGFLLPGDRVDVQVTARIDKDRETQVLLENVAVLAVDGAMTEESRRAGEREAIGAQSPAVTLLVTPREALALTHAHREGDVQLALRSRIDLDSVPTTAVNMRALLGRENQPVSRAHTPPRERPVKGEIFEIIVGSERRQILVGPDGTTL